LANLGKIVYISALSGSFKSEPFPNVSRLISRADKIIHLKSVCDYCGAKGSFTLRTTDDSDDLIVGGAEMYKPACRKCFYERHKH
jgi:thymidine kinase